MSNNYILVVDDAPDIRSMIGFILSRGDHVIIEAKDGIEAIELAHRYRPALIILDINLPGMDGVEVARQLRADPALEDVPIIAMTAYAVSSTANMARRAGCQRVIFKPFSLDAFAEEVAAMLALPMPVIAALPHSSR